MSAAKNVKLVIVFMCLLGLVRGEIPGKTKDLKYRFDYCFQMDMEGKLLYLISYRFYYEAAASVHFKAWKTDNGGYRFCFDGISGPGYVMSTGGLNGTSLYFFTADYDLKRAETFREKKIAAFKQAEPYYSKNIGKIRRRPMKILSNGEDSLGFARDDKGVHSKPGVNVHLSDSHSFTYSFIYKILGQLLLAYNHSFLPAEGIDFLVQTGEHVWYSKPLDFSKVLQATAKLTSEDAEKRARFKQRKKFRVTYRVLRMDDESIEICGDCQPNIRVWEKMKIREFTRMVTLRLEDNVVTKDLIFLDFRDDKGRGGTVRLNLELRKSD